jgi:hypothetical protein
VRTLGVMLSGDTIDVRDVYSRSIQDDTYLMLLNAHHEPLSFVLPGQEEVRWELVLDTRVEEGFLEDPRVFASSDEYEIRDRSFSLLRLRLGEQSQARAASRKKRTKTWQIQPSRGRKEKIRIRQIDRDHRLQVQILKLI